MFPPISPQELNSTPHRDSGISRDALGDAAENLFSRKTSRDPGEESPIALLILLLLRV